MELEILRFIQSFKTPFLDGLFELITFMGEELFIGLVFGVCYWAVDKRLGEYLGKSLFSSLLLNSFLKNLFCLPRPIGEEGIVSIRTETATGYSFPSGHSQMNSTLYSALSLFLKKRWFSVVSAVAVLLIGFSRLYLGVHYPKDVLVGIALGFLVSFAVLKLGDKFYLVSIVFLLPILFGATEEYIKYLALLYGFVFGTFFEKRFVSFKTEGISVKTKALRLIFGAVTLGAIVLSFEMFLPKSIYLSVIKYFVITFYGVGIFPYIFTKIENKKERGEVKNEKIS